MTNPKKFETAAESAASHANQSLAAKEERLVIPTWEGIRRMLPKSQDQEKFDEMMKIVRQDTSHNEKVAAVLHNINSVADVMVKIMGKLA